MLCVASQEGVGLAALRQALMGVLVNRLQEAEADLAAAGVRPIADVLGRVGRAGTERRPCEESGRRPRSRVLHGRAHHGESIRLRTSSFFRK